MEAGAAGMPELEGRMLCHKEELEDLCPRATDLEAALVAFAALVMAAVVLQVCLEQMALTHAE